MRSLSALLAALMAVFWSLWPRLALACPNCRLGQQVRARVFAEDFWTTLGVLLLPLLVMGAVAAALYRIGRPPAAVARRAPWQAGKEVRS